MNICKYLHHNFVLILLILFLIYLVVSSKSITEKFNNNYTYSTDGELNNIFIDVLKTLNITKVDKDGNFFIPSDYNPCEQMSESLAKSKSKYIYLMDGCDIIGSKMDLWSSLKDTYQKEATNIMPKSYLYEYKEDMDELKLNFDNGLYKNKMFILKNYEQRQEGLKIVKTLDEINDPENQKKYYLIQEYLYDPFIISKRKINIRVYYLIICRNNKIEGYIYNDGFMYYTPKFYDPNDADFDKHITTGYIDRKVYEENPLTIQDFKKYLADNYDFGYVNKFNKNVQDIMYKVTKSLSTKVCKKNYNDKVRFQVYGVDIAPSSDLSVKLMEINKGPDLGSKDERDGKVKYNMQLDIFKVLEPEFGSTNGFSRVY